MSAKDTMSRGRSVRVALLVLGPVLPVLGFLVWRWNENRPPSHALCVEQAERRLERIWGERLAREANEHPRDYDAMRSSMIRACEGYWSRRYAECMRDVGGFGLTQQCEDLGRVRPR